MIQQEEVAFACNFDLKFKEYRTEVIHLGHSFLLC